MAAVETSLGVGQNIPAQKICLSLTYKDPSAQAEWSLIIQQEPYPDVLLTGTRPTKAEIVAAMGGSLLPVVLADIVFVMTEVLHIRAEAEGEGVATKKTLDVAAPQEVAFVGYKGPQQRSEREPELADNIPGQLPLD